MAGQANGAEKRPGGRGHQGQEGSFTRPDLAIPCRVARQQSPTPFRQTPQILTETEILQHSFALPCLKKRSRPLAGDFPKFPDEPEIVP